MAFRIPRGYDVQNVPYRELSEGVRPGVTAIPLEAWSGLPPVRVDELHDDPIVFEPGTLVGIATGGDAVGKLFPAHALSGTNQITLAFSADDSKWGLPTADTTPTADAVCGGQVKPLGVVYQPVYSFNLQTQFTNYKRNESVGILTDYLIQVPVRTSAEHAIQPGDLVMVNKTANRYGRIASATDANSQLGTFQAWDGSTVGDLEFVVGRCFNSFVFATGANTSILKDDSTAAITSAGREEFKGLDKVQTVPGLGLAGSGTGGIPAWLTSAISDGSGNYRALTILVRL
ncbi:MAG: hypothetical protein D6710_08245 [Nitrospirae bacterium]|nr:MAG: hypothetical protein D6710_08245 [Nitrospirota bacterium]